MVQAAGEKAFFMWQAFLPSVKAAIAISPIDALVTANSSEFFSLHRLNECLRADLLDPRMPVTGKLTSCVRLTWPRKRRQRQGPTWAVAP